MKKWHRAFLIIICVLLMLYSLVYFFVIPKAAEASVPYRWKNIVSGLKRNKYEMYLGRPSAGANKDVWIVRNGNYTFSLETLYSKDSTAQAVQINYTFSNYLFHKQGTILKDEE